MKITMKKIFTIISIAIAGFAFAFDWPQQETNADSFASYFGQLRGGRIEASLIFQETSQIKAAEAGDYAVIITNHTNDFGWFESPLGNCIVISHDKNLVTVYGNMDEESLPNNFDSTVSKAQVIGESGNSSWQDKDSGLEFMVLDTKNKTAVNPRMLMPRIGEEMDLKIGEITLDDKDGKTHSLLNEKTLSAGTYKIYHDRQATAVPFKTGLGINGLTVETLSYDTLLEYNGRLCISGNEKYSVKDMYPDSKRQLLGTIHFVKGHSTISIAVSDILGKTHQTRYNIDIN